VLQRRALNDLVTGCGYRVDHLAGVEPGAYGLDAPLLTHPELLVLAARLDPHEQPPAGGGGRPHRQRCSLAGAPGAETPLAACGESPAGANPGDPVARAGRERTPDAMGRPAIVTREAVALSEFELLARVFRTLGDPTRLRILEALERLPETSQSELISHTGVTQSRASERTGTWTPLGK
jgi:hypothetical protein